MLVRGRHISMEMTEALATLQPDCIVCGEPLDMGYMIIYDTSQNKLFHPHQCERRVIRSYIIAHPESSAAGIGIIFGRTARQIFTYRKLLRERKARSNGNGTESV